jgi:apolipoprotein N-acyltransferase
LAIVFPVVWVACEWIRYWAFQVAVGENFTLLWLGQAVVGQHQLMQAADLGGVTVLSALVAMVNGTAADVVLWRVFRDRGQRGPAPVVASAGGTVVVLVATWLYGAWRLEQPLGEAGPRVALVRGRICERTDLDLFRGLAQKLAWQQWREREEPGQKVDFYLWPEAAWQEPLWALTRKASTAGNTVSAGKGEEALRAVSRKLDAPVLLGAWRRAESEEAHRQQALPWASVNSLIYCTPSEGIKGIYDKQHLVPLLEHVPEWLDRLGWWPPECVRLWQLHRGPRAACRMPEAFLLTDRAGRCLRIGPLVCYDICFSGVHRRLMRAAVPSRPDFFVCAMDESFDQSGKVSQITMLHTRLRAVEFRRPHFRVSVGGTTAVIDSCGRVVGLASGMPEEVPVLLARAPIDSRCSPYCTLGDLLPVLCLIAVTGTNALGIAGRCLRGRFGNCGHWRGRWLAKQREYQGGVA